MRTEFRWLIKRKTDNKNSRKDVGIGMGDGHTQEQQIHMGNDREEKPGAVGGQNQHLRYMPEASDYIHSVFSAGSTASGNDWFSNRGQV